ncbi:SLOG family protein [Streptomyces sp. WMMC897]|uniref:SLOG family protein n=1 Tax=Streptomyces sp. WMMC897 TaxID=3014782 RepID=UPI0022B69AC2|nr:SLOG family protein [Streptomyces sp. WMMC897]MCZ7413129.1 SLOG family protein [Streptomyces sp. WMMC897]MCZ7415487.1 SLOG family protein [Streptomyces sp. WMMC897]
MSDPTTQPYRALVTGSRDWDDATAIAAALEQVLVDAGPRPVVVVHGACPRGADTLADHYARWLRGQGCAIGIEQHPARWRIDGRQAGFIRNAAMVRLGADVCLAFIRDGSRGASHTAGLAEAAGIPTRRYTA